MTHRAGGAGILRGLCSKVPAIATAAVMVGLAVVPDRDVAAWDVKSSVKLSTTATDNLRLEPDAAADAGVSVDVVPNLRATEKSSRLDAALSYAPRLIFYPFGSGSTSTQNSLSAVGKLKAVPDTIVIDADASIAQDYLSPFGATAVDDGTKSKNFIETSVFGLSPAWIGRLGPDVSYEARYRWKHVSTGAASAQDSVATQWSAVVDKAVVHHWGWSLNVRRRDTDYSVRPDTYDQRSVATLRLRVDPELTFSFSGGYETNSFSLANKSSANYGMGVFWSPTTRSQFSANWDHRYFGEAYAVSLTHKFRRSRVSFTANRDASTFAERFLDTGLINPETGDLLINERLDKLYPDPQNRQTVGSYLNSLGYTEDSLLGIYTDEISRRERMQIVYDIYGARNSLSFSVYRREISTVIETFSPSIPADIGLNSNNVQKGASVSHSYSLTPRATVSSRYTRSNTTSTIPGNNGESTEDNLRVSVTQRLTGKTTATLGARYLNLNSNVGLGYTERAVFGTINHTF